jgi:hypothetical protein
MAGLLAILASFSQLISKMRSKCGRISALSFDAGLVLIALELVANAL